MHSSPTAGCTTAVLRPLHPPSLLSARRRAVGPTLGRELSWVRGACAVQSEMSLGMDDGRRLNSAASVPSVHSVNQIEMDLFVTDVDDCSMETLETVPDTILRLRRFSSTFLGSVASSLPWSASLMERGSLNRIGCETALAQTSLARVSYRSCCCLR